MGNAIKSAIGKLTGADVAADVAERGAEAQAAAIRASAEQSAKTARESAAQAARAQEAAAARSAAEQKASETLTIPMEAPDVSLAGAPPEAGVSAAARKRRQTFGIGSSGAGVNI